MFDIHECCENAKQRSLLSSHLGILNHSAVLNVKSPDFGKISAVGSVAGDELRHDRHLLRRVNRELCAAAKVFVVVQSVRRKVAAVLVTDAVVPVPVADLVNTLRL